MRTIDELIHTADPALPLLSAWASEGGMHCEFLPPAPDADQVLLSLQVTTRSPLGAIAHGTGGILVDRGWLRMLGSGHSRLARSIIEWNAGRSDGFLLVADDAVGGFFAINGGALGDDQGGMYYFAPDTFEWEAMGLGHTHFVQWAFTRELQAFYADLRWPGWEEDLQGLSAQQCFHFYPLLHAAQGSVQTSSRRAVRVAEQYALSAGLPQR